MKYQIVYDRPGRIRLRLGRYAFTRKQGYAIEESLKKNTWVQAVETNSANGSILAVYSGGAQSRAELLRTVAGLKSYRLEEREPNPEQEIREMDAEFIRSVVCSAALHYGKKWFLPAPVRLAHTVWKASGYVRRALGALSKGKLNVEVLDGASVVGALLQHSSSTASSIMFLLHISGMLEDYTRKRTKNALAGSLAVHVDHVWLVTDGKEVQIPIAQVRVGDQIRVQCGNMIPVDGVVTDGEAMVNEASMTGEPLAVCKKPGKTVYAGSVVEEGSVVLKVLAMAENSRISKIVQMIDQSENLKAGVQASAERMADSIVPFSFLTSAAVLLLTRNVTKALSVLMVDYSCAIKLSIPIAVISAMKEAANHQMVVKGGKFLEAYAKADTIIFDKTGTLTCACPRVAAVIPVTEDYDETEVLRIAACLEEHFPHSVARAVVQEAAGRGVMHEEEHAEVEYVVAHGIATMWRGMKARIGSAHFIFDDEEIPYPEEQREALEGMTEGMSVIYLAVGGRLIGLIGIEDPVRSEAAETVRELKRLGIRHVMMMTGDGEAAARRACGILGIDEYRAQVLPEDKSGMVERLKAEGRTVIMVGDGINDSPALAAADVSVAMKDSSDIAREVADITLLGNSLEELVVLRKLSGRLLERISGNYRCILSFNTGLLALGIAGILPPSTSAVLHNASTMVISGLSMRPYLGRGDGERP